jgi:hypothetical protein
LFYNEFVYWWKIIIALVEAIGEFDADSFAIQHCPLVNGMIEEKESQKKK